MENRSKFEELVVAYLANELNREEETFVQQWIDSSKENRKYFKELESTYNLLRTNREIKSIDIDTEWQRLKESIHVVEDETFDGAPEPDYQLQHDPVYDSFLVASEKNRKRKRYITGSLLVLIIGVVGLFVFTHWFHQRESTELGLSARVNANTGERDYNVHHERNISKVTKELLLEDGSEILLKSNSELWFMVPFPELKRNINLIGSARFQVAKDSKKPFTVISGDISTTALGTVFTVDAYDHSAVIQVRLYEGRVVIKSTEEANKKIKSDIFLKPGQELTYNKADGGIKIKRFRLSVPDQKNINSNGGHELKDDPLMPRISKGSWYMFNNQKLTDVFDQLEAMFETDIVYNKKQLDNIYFIGKFSKDDSLEVILKRISLVNDLSIIQKNNKYYVTNR